MNGLQKMMHKEPVAYISEVSLSFLNQRKDIGNISWRLNLATSPSGDETVGLYTNPNLILPDLLDKIDEVLRHASGVEQCIGHIKSGANVTPSELWSACDSLDQVFAAIRKAKELLKS